MFKNLQQHDLLESSLSDAAAATSEAMQELMAEGFSATEAWEAVREQYLFLPEEPGNSEEAPVSEGLRLQREMNDAMKYLGMTDRQIEAAKLDE